MKVVVDVREVMGTTLAMIHHDSNDYAGIRTLPIHNLGLCRWPRSRLILSLSQVGPARLQQPEDLNRNTNNSKNSPNSQGPAHRSHQNSETHPSLVTIHTLDVRLFSKILPHYPVGLAHLSKECFATRPVSAERPTSPQAALTLDVPSGRQAASHTHRLLRDPSSAFLRWE